jgi:hypothetical protein
MVAVSDDAKEKQRAYQRDYQRKRSMIIKQMREKQKHDFNASDPNKSSKKENKSSEIEVLSQIRGIVKAVDEYKPFIQGAGKFFIGVAKAMISKGKSNDKSNDKTNNKSMIQPPQGWVNMRPLERLKSKFDESGNETNWWKQGIAYQNQLDGGDVFEDNLAIPNQDISNDNQPNIPQNSGPRNLKELSAMYPDTAHPSVNDVATNIENNTKKENDMTNDKTKQELQRRIDEANERAGRTKQVEDEDLDESNEVKEEVKEDKKEEVKEEVKENKEVQETQNKENGGEKMVLDLDSDNKKYLGIGAGYINGINDDELLNYLNNPDEIISKFSKFKALVPIHLKCLINQTSVDIFVELFKNNCKEKYSKIVELKKEKELELFFKKIKGVFSE